MTLKLLKIIRSVSYTLALLIVISSALLFVTAKLHGDQILTIQTGSMAPTLHRGDVVVVQKELPSKIRRGDVITFTDPGNPRLTLTHRVVNTPAIWRKDEFQTKGDANSLADMPIQPNAILGKVRYSVPEIGSIFNFVRQPLGLIILVYIPSMLIVVSELRRVIRYYGEQEPYRDPIMRRKRPKSRRQKYIINLSSTVPALLLFIGISAIAYAALSVNSSLSGNTISASVPQLPVCYVSGTLTENMTWTPDCVYVADDVEVPDDITLTIDPGVIVKVESGDGIVVSSGGTLNVTGTSGNPVIFTSTKDDSVGGDTLGQGPTTPGVGDYTTSIVMNGGTVNATYAHFEYGSVDISDGGADGSNLTVTDSSFTNGYNGISIGDDSSAETLANVTLQRNNFTLNTPTEDDAITVWGDPDLSGIVLSGTNENTFTGSGPNVTVASSYSDVPLGSTWTVASTSGAIVETYDSDTINGALTLGSNVTLVEESGNPLTVNGTMSIGDGDIVKSDSGGITVSSGGTLNVTGTSGNPVIFTSTKDDSVGGDTLGQGPTTPGVGDYTTSIVMNGGTVNATYAHFEYGSVDISDGGADGSNLTVTDSSFTNGYNGISIGDDSSAETLANVTLQRNNFTLNTPTEDDAITVWGDPDLSGIVLSGTNENTFTGSGPNVTVASSYSDVPLGSTWTVASTSGAIVETYDSDTINGALTLGSNVTLVEESGNPLTVNGTMSIGDGDIVKSDSGGITVSSGGTLNVTGTSGNPVIFTSTKDDSVGGDTLGQGPTTPGVGDYTTSIVMNGGTVNATYAHFEYGSVDISDGGADGSNLTVTDSSFTNGYNGISIGDDSSAETLANVTLQRNNFTLNTPTEDDAITVWGDPDLSGIVLSGTNENTFTGSGPNVTVASSYSDVPLGSTWTVASTSGAIVETYDSDTINGALTLGSNVTLVEESGNPLTVNGTMSIGDGDIVKSDSGGITVSSGGTLNVTGTSGNPVIFTSTKDDSVGGDTLGQGPTTPGVGDYTTSIVMNGGTVNATYAHFEYGSVDISDGGADGSNLTVTDSSFTNGYNGISIGDDSSAETLANVTLQRNNFTLNTPTEDDAITVWGDPDLSGIVLSGTNENTFTGSGPNVTVASSYSDVPLGSTWTVASTSGAIVETYDSDTINGALTLGSNVTLVEESGNPLTVNGTMSIGDGDIVKSDSGGITVSSGGTLNVTGTSGNPVIFTSTKDDSVGGDTLGQGPTTPGVGDYTTSIVMNGGTVNATYAHFEYGSVDISDGGADGSNLTVTDSSFTNGYNGISIGDDSSAETLANVTLQRNNFTLNTPTEDDAITVWGDPDLSGIVLSGTNENTFTGSGPNVTVASSYSDVPLGSTWTVASTSGAIVETYDSDTINGALTLGSNVTLVEESGNPLTVNGTMSIGDGDIVKSDSGGITVSSGGTLNVTGTSGNPVIFTSTKDDSVGGDTLGQGPTTPGVGDYTTSIVMNGGTVNATYAHFEYGSVDISDGGADGSNLTVTDSSFTNGYNGISIGDDSSAETLANVTLQRNNFTLNTPTEDDAITVWGDPDLSGIVLSGTNENTFTGSGPNVTVASSYSDVPLGSTWTVASTSGAIVETYDSDTINGALTLGSNVTLVEESGNPLTVNGTMSIGDGDIVKSDSGGITVSSGGTLNVTGTSGNPVIFTSTKDDSVGGDTLGQGPTTPGVGDYTTAIRFDNADKNDLITYALFRYASTAISIGPLGTLSVSNSQFAYNQAAFGADTTSTIDPALGADCVPPYANSIYITGSWFGSSGLPGSAIDILGFASVLLPDNPPELGEIYSAASSLIPVTGNLGDNTIPWSLWTCVIPPLGVDFSVPDSPVNPTPFLLNTAIAQNALWPNLEEK